MKKLLIFLLLILVNATFAGCLINKSKTKDSTSPVSQVIIPDQPITPATDSSQSQNSEPAAPYESTEPLIPRGKAIKDHLSNEIILEITDFAFSSKVFTIEPGTKVTWINTGNAAHSLMSKENLFFSAVLMHGDSFSYIYPESGIYNYYCGIHTGMVGTVLVK